MSWIQVGSMIGTMVGAAYMLWKEVRGLEEKIDRQGARTDRLYEQFQCALHDQTSRTDKLYEMFIDLLKEGRR